MSASSPAEVDIVIPFVEGWAVLAPCLRSIARFTRPPYRVILVDDGSSSSTYRRVGRLVEDLKIEAVEILRHDETVGYVDSVNDGIRCGTSPYVVILNSDVIVTPKWTEGLLECIDSRATIAAATPLSNHANFSRFPIPDGFSLLELAEAIRRLSKRHYPDIGIGSGFCFATKRSRFDEIGLFDEVYRPGYYEESDWCMRAFERGLTTVADDATFIYHRGSSTFGAAGRNRYLLQGQKIFRGRWGGVHEDLKARYLETKPFEALAQQLIADRRSRAKKAETHWLRPKWRESSRLTSVLQRRGRVVTRTGKKRAFFVEREPVLRPGGWLQRLLNGLIQRGWEATLATANIEAWKPMRRALFRPMELLDGRRLAHELAPYSIVFAVGPKSEKEALLMAEAWDAVALGVKGSSEAGRWGLRRWIDHDSPGGIPLGVDDDVFFPPPSAPEDGPRRFVAWCSNRLIERALDSPFLREGGHFDLLGTEPQDVHGSITVHPVEDDISISAVMARATTFISSREDPRDPPLSSLAHALGLEIIDEDDPWDRSPRPIRRTLVPFTDELDAWEKLLDDCLGDR